MGLCKNCNLLSLKIKFLYNKKKYKNIELALYSRSLYDNGDLVRTIPSNIYICMSGI